MHRKIEMKIIAWKRKTKIPLEKILELRRSQGIHKHRWESLSPAFIG